MKEIAKYQNGTYTITLFEDGTKVREGDVFEPAFPESMDVKITNFCNAGCGYCHENSTREGKHGDLEWLVEKLSTLPKGTEIAIGGGNPLSHPNLYWFLDEVNKLGLIPNITINSLHVNDNIYKLREKVRGVGISYNPVFRKKIVKYVDENTVIHVIAGVHRWIDVLVLANEIKEATGKDAKILILGFKIFGRGIKYAQAMSSSIDGLDAKMKDWFTSLFYFVRNDELSVVSFDTLAIQQLQVWRLFGGKDSQAFKDLYMGDDGQFTMYLDAVEKQFAVTSRSVTRWSLDGSIQDAFNVVKSY